MEQIQFNRYLLNVLNKSLFKIEFINFKIFKTIF